MAGLKTFDCKRCGSRFEREFNGGTFLYCGNACKVAACRAASPERKAMYRQTEANKRALERAPYQCRECSTVVPMRRKLCDQCKIKPIAPRHCSCGAGIGPFVQCCDDCRLTRATANKRRARKSEWYKTHKRAYRVWRKAKERGAEAERFDPIEVLKRDRWRCHICGIYTPPRLRGTYDDRAPELDHIVPLAVGGEHSRRNTACACRKCNLIKGNKPLGQTRLVA